MQSYRRGRRLVLSDARFQQFVHTGLLRVGLTMSGLEHFAFECHADAVDFYIGKFFNSNEAAACFCDSAKDFIELGLDGTAISILAVLNQKYG